jgi:hypothetical protein
LHAIPAGARKFGADGLAQIFNTLKDWRERGYQLLAPPLALVGYDAAADGDDHDALVLNSREEHQHGEKWDPDFSVLTAYRVLLAHRMAKGLEFPDKLAQLLKLHRLLSGWRRKGRVAGHVFTVETNGVGHAMASALRSRIGHAHVLGYTTVGNASANSADEQKLVMPRLAGLDHLRVLAETHVLKVARGAPGAEELTKEMSTFVWRRPGRPEALQGQHDDLVMGLAGTTWCGSRHIPPLLKAVRYRPSGRTH